MAGQDAGQKFYHKVRIHEASQIKKGRNTLYFRKTTKKQAKTVSLSQSSLLLNQEKDESNLLLILS